MWLGRERSRCLRKGILGVLREGRGVRDIRVWRQELDRLDKDNMTIFRLFGISIRLAIFGVKISHLHSTEELTIPQLLPLPGLLCLTELHEDHVLVGTTSSNESEVTNVFSRLVSDKAQQI